MPQNATVQEKFMLMTYDRMTAIEKCLSQQYIVGDVTKIRATDADFIAYAGTLELIGKEIHEAMIYRKAYIVVKIADWTAAEYQQIVDNLKNRDYQITNARLVSYLNGEHDEGKVIVVKWRKDVEKMPHAFDGYKLKYDGYDF